MVKKELKLVLLPTNDNNPTTIPFLLSSKNILCKHAAGGEFRKLCNSGYIPYHLYAISDEKPKVGDYYLANDRIVQWNQELQDLVDNHERIFNEKSQNIPTKKVIITTDESIGYTDHRVSPVPNFCTYPTFSQDFIDIYIEMYNKGGEIIDKIEAEYDCDHSLMPAKVIDILKVNLDNTVDVSLIDKNNFYNNLEKYFEITSKEKIVEDWNKSVELDKIGPTVDEFTQYTKEAFESGKLYTKKEIHDLLTKCWDAAVDFSTGTDDFPRGNNTFKYPDFKEFLKQNL
jgi:hypothetical protein